MTKHKKILSIFSGLLILVLAFCLTSCDLNGIKQFLNIGSDDKTSDDYEYDDSNLSNGIIYDDFKIYFIPFNNDKAGDSTYIKAGDTDILIDAGSTDATFDGISKRISKYCNDNKFEYVIATHAHQDHIASFPKVFETYKVDTIIDFDFTSTSSKTYQRYLTARDNAVANGTKHYTASECYDNKNGAQREYQLSDNVTMKIVYNKYYYTTSSNENNYSVCTLFTYKDGTEERNFFFTGDLEKEGEEAMAKYYDESTPEKTLPKCDFFKAGHHGSYTASNDCILDIIQPKTCVVSCCCGTDEYTGNINGQFPSQSFINRIAKWTDKVYIPLIYESYEIVTAKQATDGNGEPKVDKKGNPVSDKTGVEVGEQYIKTTGYKELNGLIVVSCGKDDMGAVQVGISCSNNDTLLKDTEWFNTKITLNGKERYIREKPAKWKESTEANKEE